MQKLMLKVQSFESAEVLTTPQLKNVLGGVIPKQLHNVRELDAAVNAVVKTMPTTGA
jgi:hypothetical protein